MEMEMEMDEFCEFCREQRSMVYCGSDAACLCLSCDRNVHSANALSKRHSRTLVCDQCHREPAVVRCLEEKVSLCQNCNWSGHSTPPPSLEHKRQTIDCYSGCPSAAEFSRIWSFFSFGQSACNPEAGFMTLKEGDESLSWCQMSPIDYSTEDAAMATIDSFVEQFHGSESLNPLNQKEYPLKSKQFEPVHDAIYENFNILDLDLCLDNCEALFEEYVDDPEQFFENSGIDSWFENGNSRDPECNAECAKEAKELSLKSEALKKACSNPASTNSVTVCKSEQNICSPRPAQSSLAHSFSGHATRYDTRDQGDYGGLSTVVLEEHPCNVPCPENMLSSVRRDDAVLRYKEKKKSRMFNKQVRYASRKARADIRKRVKGRFVKAGDPYDYDPLAATRKGKCCVVKLHSQI